MAYKKYYCLRCCNGRHLDRGLCNDELSSAFTAEMISYVRYPPSLRPMNIMNLVNNDKDIIMLLRGWLIARLRGFE